MTLTTKSAAARELGVSPATITQWVKAGGPSHGDKVDPVELGMWRRQNVRPRRKLGSHHRRASTPDRTDEPGDGDPVSDDAHFLRARARKEAALAEMRELDLLVRKGELVDAGEVRDRTFSLFRQERDAFLNWPARVSAVIAAELQVDAGVLLVTLEKHVREFLAARAIPETSPPAT